MVVPWIGVVETPVNDELHVGDERAHDRPSDESTARLGLFVRDLCVTGPLPTLVPRGEGRAQCGAEYYASFRLLAYPVR